MFSLILAHTNDYIPKEKFVAAGAGLQFVFGLGAMSGPFLCSIFMDLVGSNGFFIFLFFFHAVIGIFGIQSLMQTFVFSISIISLWIWFFIFTN